MREALALLGALFFFMMAIDEYPEFVSKMILGTVWLAIAIKLVAYAVGADLTL